MYIFKYKASVFNYKASAVFYCVNMAFEVERVDPTENPTVGSEEVYSTILNLENNKSCGLDHISAEHLKYAS